MQQRLRGRLRYRTHIIVGSIVVALSGIFLLFFFFDNSENAYAASSGDYRSKQSGNWSSSSTWEKFNGWYWSNASSSPDDGDKSITIQAGHTVTVNSSLEVDELTIDSAATLVVNKEFKIKNGSGVDLTVLGTMTVEDKVSLKNGAVLEIYGTVNKNSDEFKLEGNSEAKVYNGGTLIFRGGSIDDGNNAWHFYNGSTYQHDVNGKDILNATWAANSTVLVTGSTSSLPNNLSQTFGNFTISTSGLTSNKEMGSQLDNIQGNFTVLTTGSGSITMSKSSNRTIVINGSYIHQGGTLYIAEGGDPTVNIAGDMIISGGTAAASNGGDGVITYNVGGKLQINGGTLDLSQYSGSNQTKGKSTVNLSGDLEVGTGGTLTETASGVGRGVINFNGSSVQNFINNGTISNTIDVQIQNSTFVEMGTYSLTGSGDFTVSSGGGVGIGSAAGITASGANGNVKATGTRSYSTGASYKYNGTTAQVTGNGLPSTVSSLTFDNPSGVTLTNTVSSKVALILSNGIVSTGSNSLNVGISTSFTGSVSRTNGWVNGNLGRYVPMLSTGTFVFPVGGTSYNEFTAQYTVAPTLGGLLTVSFVQSPPAASGLPLFETNQYKVNTIGSKGYWTINASLGLTGGVYRISVLGNGFTGISDVANVRLLSRLSSILPWSLLGTHSNGTGTVSSPIGTRTGLGLPQQVTLGWGYNALPIELITFDAKVTEDNKVKLTWSTAAEINNEYFSLQRSENGRDFEEIGQVRGAGNTTSRRDYDFIDENPLNGESYYRLKQIDYDGRYEIFDPKHVVIKKAEIDASKITVWPNPFDDHFDVDIETESRGFLKVALMAMDGKIIRTDDAITLDPGTRWSFTDGAKLVPGTYILRLQINEEVITKKLIKK